MAKLQQITVTLAPATLVALRELGYALYVMRAFDTTNAAGKPLVWLTTTQFLENTTIAFEMKFQVYVSTSKVVANGIITVFTAAPVELGQTAAIDTGGTLTVTQGGNPTGVTILNKGTTPYTAGLAVQANDDFLSPIFAEPLHGLAEDIAAPREQFLLTFTTQGVAAGTLIGHAMSQSLLVDLAGADQQTVAFDIDTGWNAGGASWATPVPAGADLTPVLVHEKPLEARRRS
jgi:hypothetical protein